MLLFIIPGWKLLTILAIIGIITAFFNRYNTVWKSLAIGMIISMCARVYCFATHKNMISNFSEKTITVCTLFGSTFDLAKFGFKKRSLKACNQVSTNSQVD